MRHFGQREVREALQHAASGGQALHVWDPGPSAAARWPKAPAIFLKHRPWAHLFDQNSSRLVETARRLGVRRVVIDRRGGRGQHVDLCGAPLERAIAECEASAQLDDQLGLAL